MFRIRNRSGLTHALLAGVLIVLIAPTAALVALALGLGAGRPILVRTPVFGERGKRFDRITFRADSRHPVHTVLRRTGLEQVPVLLNIARGELRWIGPAPTPVSAAGVRHDADPATLPVPGAIDIAA